MLVLEGTLWLMDDAALQKLASEIRRARGSLAQREFAELLGVSYGAVQHWEKGDSLPTIESFRAIALRLGLTCEELLVKIGAVEGTMPPSAHSAKVEEILKATARLSRSELVELISALAAQLGG